MTEIKESFSFEEYEKNLDNTITKHRKTIESFKQGKVDSSMINQTKLLIKENNTLKQNIIDLKDELNEMNTKYKSLDITINEYDEKIKMLTKLIADNDTDIKEKYIKSNNTVNSKLQIVQKFLNNKKELLSHFGIKTSSDEEDISNQLNQVDVFIDKIITDNKNLIESNEQMKKYIDDITSQLQFIQNEKREIEAANYKIKQDCSMIKNQYENTITQMKTENDKIIQKITMQNENAIKILKCEKENAISQLQQLKTENSQLQSTLLEYKKTEQRQFEENNIKQYTYNYQNQSEDQFKLYNHPNIDEIKCNSFDPNPLSNLKTKLEMLECMLKDTSVDSPSIITEENI